MLGITTGISGILGIPFPNGLIPQAPFHTRALCVSQIRSDLVLDDSKEIKNENKSSHVVEQRVSNLAQGLLTLATMTEPLLAVLHLIPQGVLAGLFFIMGIKALEENGITHKILFLVRDRALTTSSEQLLNVQRSKIWQFVSIQIFGFGATFAITQTIAAVGFPIIIFLLIPVRIWLIPKLFTDQELKFLDRPTASSFTMISVGGIYGEDDGKNASNGGDSAIQANQLDLVSENENERSEALMSVGGNKIENPERSEQVINERCELPV